MIRFSTLKCYSSIRESDSNTPPKGTTMSSLKKIEANRLNAQKSTGPRSEVGKARSAQNARREGYTADVIVLSVEDKDIFNRMHQDFTDQYQPITVTEEQFLLEMVWARWRTHRIWNAESMHLERALENACVTQMPEPVNASGIAIGDEIDKLDKFARYEGRLTRQFNKAKENLLEAQQIRTAREASAKAEQERLEREATEKNEANEEPFDGEFEGYPVIPLEPAKPYLLELLGRSNDINGRAPENAPPSNGKNEAK